MTDRKNEGSVEIQRIIEAPRELVFQAWTDPEHLKRWFAPKGCTIHFEKIDIREGGSFHSCIKNPAYPDCWCIGTYLEIVEPEKIVFRMAVADKNGNLAIPASVGHDPAWPAETTVTVRLEAAGKQTLFTLHQTVSTELAKRTGAYHGWLEMLDRLDTALGKQQPGVIQS
jgi:uncharacterized protein YndB with AHSA1/START domain